MLATYVRSDDHARSACHPRLGGSRNSLPDIEKKNRLKLSPSQRVLLKAKAGSATVTVRLSVLTHYGQSVGPDSQCKAAYSSNPRPDSSIPTQSSQFPPAHLLHLGVPRVHGARARVDAAVSVLRLRRSGGSSVIECTTLRHRRKRRREVGEGSVSMLVEEGPVV